MTILNFAKSAHQYTRQSQYTRQFDSQDLKRLRMYGLPKIHKEDVSLRPILSMIDSAQHELAKYLTSLLQPVLDIYSSNCLDDPIKITTFF